ncbi:MAG TPA: PhoH family protein [Cyclobacteriaceae bacterium]
MVEKVITLENISLIDFLGIEDQNIKEVASAFPKSKIISRGNEIRIKGNSAEILRINAILNSLLEHYHKYGKITHTNIQDVLTSNINEEKEIPSKDEVLIYGPSGSVIKPRTINQQKLVYSVRENDVIFVVGPAGTGKTFVSVAMAVQALKNKEVKKIIITRPAVEAGENLGYLPGDLKEKIDPYLRPIYDSLDEMVPFEKLKFYLESRVIEIAPLAYMRGRTLNNAFILLDEAQNTTPMQIKMFLTRMGPSSKVIVTGDMTQIDLPKNQNSGLAEAIGILKDIPGVGFIELQPKDVVRHKIVRDIVEAYQKTIIKKDN